MSPPGTAYWSSFCSVKRETIREKIGMHWIFPSWVLDTIPGRTSISWPTWRIGVYTIMKKCTIITSKVVKIGLKFTLSMSCRYIQFYTTYLQHSPQYAAACHAPFEVVDLWPRLVDVKGSNDDEPRFWGKVSDWDGDLLGEILTDHLNVILELGGDWNDRSTFCYRTWARGGEEERGERGGRKAREGEEGGGWEGGSTMLKRTKLTYIYMYMQHIHRNRCCGW